MHTTSHARPSSWRRSLALGQATSLACLLAQAQNAQEVVDVPTRPGVIERLIVLTPTAPKAAVVLMAGGHGGLQISPEGQIRWGEGNFLVRTRKLFAEQGLMVVVVDAPSDRQGPPFLAGFRQTSEHLADLKAVIAWVRQRAKLPVWLVGTSRGTQSAAFVATELASPEGPDGLVLTATILRDDKSRAVPALPLPRLKVPVLVVMHEQDACAHCNFADTDSVMKQLAGTPRHQLLSFKGGQTRGDACEAWAYHGFNGLEGEVVGQIAAWIKGPTPAP